MGQTHSQVLAEAASPTDYVIQFKLFAQAPSEPLSHLCERVEAFVEANPCQAKSIGIEFLECAGVNIITLGYDVKARPSLISLDFQEIGNVHNTLISPSEGTGDHLDIATIQSQMAAFSAQFPKALCHEISIHSDGRMTMLVMSEKAVEMTEPCAE